LRPYWQKLLDLRRPFHLYRTFSGGLKPRLEPNPHAELNIPREIILLDGQFAEERIVKVRIRSAQQRGVSGVESLAAHLDLPALGNLKLLGDSDVELRNRRIADPVEAVADGAEGEGRPLRITALVVVELLVGVLVRYDIAATGELRIRPTGRRSGIIGQYPVEVPAAGQSVEQLVVDVQAAALPYRDVPYARPGELLRPVDAGEPVVERVRRFETLVVEKRFLHLLGVGVGKHPDKVAAAFGREGALFEADLQPVIPDLAPWVDVVGDAVKQCIASHQISIIKGGAWAEVGVEWQNA